MPAQPEPKLLGVRNLGRRIDLNIVRALRTPAVDEALVTRIDEPNVAKVFTILAEMVRDDDGAPRVTASRL